MLSMTNAMSIILQLITVHYEITTRIDLCCVPDYETLQNTTCIDLCCVCSFLTTRRYRTDCTTSWTHTMRSLVVLIWTWCSSKTLWFISWRCCIGDNFQYVVCCISPTVPLNVCRSTLLVLANSVVVMYKLTVFYTFLSNLSPAQNGCPCLCCMKALVLTSSTVYLRWGYKNV